MEKLPLKTFFDNVEQRLAACSTDELREILRAMAQQTSLSERQAFLEKLNPQAETASLAQRASQEDLIARIEDIAAEVEQAMEEAEPWEDNHGWYDHDDEDSLEPYADFTQPLAGLFDQAQAAFDYGNLSLARDAYEALFDLCDQEDNYGRGVSIEDIEGLDIDEAYARYLRVVYETAPVEQRPEELFKKMLQVRSWISRAQPTLECVIQISPKPLPDLERFWPEWIAFLEDQPGSDADARLREAIRLSEGTAGLEKLARSQGKQRPRAYLDWLANLEQEGLYAEELAAAQEALQTLSPGLPIRATVADRLCNAAIQLKNTPALRAGRSEAFLVAPVLKRLLDLWEVTPGEERLHGMKQAVRRIRDYMAQPRSESSNAFPFDDGLERPVWIQGNVLAHACLLAEDWRSVHQIAAKEPVLGWSSSESTQGLVSAFFLVLLSGKSSGALPGNLTKLWQQKLADSSGYVYSSGSSLVKRLEAAYAELFTHISLDADQQAEILSWCLDTAYRRVDAIVGGQRRGSYDKAAMLTAACTETLLSRGEKALSNEFLITVRERFPRHRSFQSELNEAVRLMQQSE